MNHKRLMLFVVALFTAAVATAQFKLYEKGHDSYTAGKYADAITNFSEYLTRGTRDKALDVEVFYLRALSYYKSNKFQEAVGDFQETLLLDHPNRGNIYWFLAKCYEKNNAMAECVNAYNYALRELDGNKEAKEKLLWERSQIHVRMNNLPQSYLDVKSLTTLNPSHADGRRELERLEKQGIKPASTQAVVVAAAERVVEKPADKPADAQRVENVVEKPVEKPRVPTLADMYKGEKRYALVIGNAGYPKTIGALRNPVNDATDFARELEGSGFEVQLLTDATYGQMRAAMLRFKEKVDAGDKDKTVSLFYFAGHGVQRDEENWLVPVDAVVEYEDDIQRYCFPVQRMVLSNMERSNSRMNIVILDACRNNPFPALNRSLGDEGLGEMRRAMGSFIAYATAPGSVASDGTGRNGLYTQELIKAIRKPGLTIEQVFKEVRQSVLRLSGNRQNTWDSSNIIGEFYFRFAE